MRVVKKKIKSSLICREKDEHYSKWKPADTKASNDHHHHRSYPAMQYNDDDDNITIMIATGTTLTVSELLSLFQVSSVPWI